MSKIGYLVCSIFIFCALVSDKGPHLSRYLGFVPLNFPTCGNRDQAEVILKQKFFFLSSGGQCDVFASEDGKYVLKFFKNTPLPLPLPQYRKRKLAKLQRDLSGYALAFERLQEETGLICAGSSFPSPVRLYDKLHCQHTFDLEKTCFVLQKRAEPLPLPLPRATLEAIYSLLQKQAQMQVQDSDPRQHKNIGLLEGRPIFLDPGKFSHDPQAKPAFSEKFEKWQKN